MSKTGKLFILSGPSGAGKSTIVKNLARLVPRLVVSVSATTRKLRPGEKDGIDYFFLSEQAFKEKAEKKEFLEWAEVHGNLYGTLISTVDENLMRGRDVVLEIDVQGALQVKEKMPDSVLIFVEPPRFDELAKRLKERSTEDKRSLELRLENARYELAARKYYNYRVVNDRLERAIGEVAKIIEKERKG